MTEPSNKPKWWMHLAQTPRAPLYLIAAITLLRLLWQLISPYTLAEDEAHYWEWSRHLDWSYYSKGPGVAWSIFASTSILGNTELAVRLPALVASTLGAIAVYNTAKVVYDNQLITFVSTLLWFCVPGLAITSMVMTIDAPYTACWAWAVCFAARALINNKPSYSLQKAWIGFGLSIAIGFLFKYTILLLIPAALIALFISKQTRAHWRWFALGLAVSCLGLIPVIIWNANHDWATVRHLLGHLGAPGGDTQGTAYTKDPWTPLWMLEYILLQILISGGVIILAIFAYLNTRKHNNNPATTRNTNTLLLLALPIFAFYLIVSLVTQTEGNWAMAGIVSLIPPAAWAVIDGIKRNDHPVKAAWGATIFFGVSCLLFFPVGIWLSQRTIIGQYIPISRLTGMREHAASAQAVLDDLESRTGQQPLILTEHYGRASQLAFYLKDHPTTYCISALVGGRKTQYDLWPSTNLANPDTLAPLQGRPALLMGGYIEQWTPAFDQVKDISKLDSEPVDNRTSYIGYNFTNFNSWTPPGKRDKTTITP